jgi:tRNA 2-thiouridine synthesizing protein A
VAPGNVVRLLACDPTAAIDVPHSCAGAGHIYLGTEDVPGGAAYLVRKG